MRFADFADEQAISKLYEDCHELLDTCENLIIDVRGNGGGVDLTFIPLIEYSFPAGEPVDNYVKTEYPTAINYSERNCRIRIDLLKNFMGDNAPDYIKTAITKSLSDIENNKGKGFVIDNDDTPGGIIGKETPKKVWVITDEQCASSGDAFVEEMSFSPKVTVVGRPTCGITDYSNLSIINWGD